jgi:hypothetical protein
MKHVFRVMLLGLVLTTASCEDKKEDEEGTEDTTDQPQVDHEDDILVPDSTDRDLPIKADEITSTDSAAVDSL